MAVVVVDRKRRELTAGLWARLEPQLDSLLALDEAERVQEMQKIRHSDPLVCQQLEALLDADCGQTIEQRFEQVARALYGPEPDSDDGSIDPFLDTHCGAYRLTRKLGEGGNAVVYEGCRDDGRFERRVAVKLLPGCLQSSAARERFEQEQQALASLHHPNIAQLYDGGINDDGHGYIVMELVDGQTIDSYVQQVESTVEERLDLLLQVAEALHYAHRNLLIHRDVKPSNILVSNAGQVKLVDFGIAKLVQTDQALTRTGPKPLTPAYAAPEQILGQATTVSTDIYQLGLVAHELLGGQPPFAAQYDSIYQLSKAICETDPEPPGRSCRSRGSWPGGERFGPDLDAIVLKAMAKSPAHRYSSMDALVADLHRYIDRRPVKAYRARWSYVARKFIRRHRFGAVAGLAFVVSAGIYAVTFALQSKQLQATVVELREQTQTSESVAELIVQLFQQLDPGEARGQQISAHDLVDRAHAALQAQDIRSPAIQVQLEMVLSDIYFALGGYRQAADLHESVLTEARRLYAGQPLKLAPILTRMAALHGNAEQPQRSPALLDEALAIYRDYQPLSVGHGEALNVMGHVQLKLHEIARAEGYLLDAKSILRQLPVDRELSINYSLMADLRDRQTRLPEAVDLLRQSLRIYEQTVGREDWRRSVIRRNLAEKLGALQHYDEAERLLREELTVQQHQLGSDHPRSIRTRHMLATLQHRMGHFDQAQANFRDVLDWQTNNPDVDPQSLARTQSALGNLLNVIGQHREAETLFEQVRDTHQSQDAVNSSLLAYAYTQLAIARHGQGKAAWMDGFLQARALVPVDNYYASIAQIEQARLLVHEHRYQDALVLSMQSLTTRRQRLPEGHIDLVRAKAIVGASLAGLGRRDEALDYLNDSYPQLKDYWPCCNDFALQAKVALNSLSEDRSSALVVND